VTAEQPAGRDGGQPGQPQQAGGPRATLSQRRRVQAEGCDVSRGVDHADAHLLLVLLGPVGRTSERGGDRRADPGRDQAAGRLLAGAGEVEDARGQPGARGGLNQHRVHRMPEPHAVQRVAHLARPDQPGHPLACRYGGVEAGLLLETGDQSHDGPACPWPA
jgi:hypothetical protein